ncbi:MAG TPA: TIGR04283 family arsenosugar biosynthesis glycosyltransferase [Methylomirabilota bacterium]|jgi:rSAM/selenodomain-associated transferase 2
MSEPALSVVIPARNDAEALGRTLDHLARLDGPDRFEVIVAAAGGRAETERAAAGRARLLWPGESTRARLLNAGAAVARGPALLFLHADSLPPRDAVALIDAALRRPETVGGAFEFLFAEPVWTLRLLTAMNRFRYRTTGNYYGDQGLFVRADVFRRLGGFRDLALMEDIDWSRRLRRAGHTVLIPTPVVTSGRRFLARGPWRTTAFCAWLLLLNTLRLDTERYAERWRGPADRPPGSAWPTAPR